MVYLAVTPDKFHSPAVQPTVQGIILVFAYWRSFVIDEVADLIMNEKSRHVIAYQSDVHVGQW